MLSLVDQSRRDGHQFDFRKRGHPVRLYLSQYALLCLTLSKRFDQDFNPHNDKQAQDRAYRIGQKRDVEVVKLITRNSIEEDMLRLGQTKLALDEAVAGDGSEQAGEDVERKMKTSLMSTLRKQLANAAAGDAEA
jgi:hypothetical protein